MPERISELAALIGIDESQLAKLHGELKTDDALRGWLQSAERDTRERRYMLAKGPGSYVRDEAGELHFGYTETVADPLDAGEAPPPNEIASYRMSREAKRRFEDEQMEEVGGLMAAMREVRNALEELPEELRRRHNRAIWSYKGRMDELERQIRRDIAA